MKSESKIINAQKVEESKTEETETSKTTETDKDLYYVKQSNPAKYKFYEKKSKSNRIILEKNFKGSSPMEITEIAEEKLSQEILQAYKKNNLYKGSEEVLSAICFDLGLKKVYVVGYTDISYELKLEDALKHKCSENLSVVRIPFDKCQIVYKLLKKEPNPKSPIKTRELPRRHFFCRFIGIRQDENWF